MSHMRGNDRRQGAERREAADRRTGLDRRGSGLKTPSSEPRLYAFRPFADRRGRQDRRLYGRGGLPFDRRTGDVEGFAQDPVPPLTPEEILFILRATRANDDL
jgi:hypothetical protein